MKKLRLNRRARERLQSNNVILDYPSVDSLAVNYLNRPFPSLLCLCFKTSLSANLSYENEFCTQFHFHANQSHFHKNGFALRLTLKQRHKGTRKWPIKNESNCRRSKDNTQEFKIICFWYLESLKSLSFGVMIFWQKERHPKISLPVIEEKRRKFAWLKIALISL